MQDEAAAQARLGPVDELDLRPAFQPIVDLRDGAVVGYEALIRAEGEIHSAPALLEAARREHSTVALDLAARDAALRAADAAPDLATRSAALRDAEARLLARQVVIPIYHYSSKHLVRPEVRGWQANPLDHHPSRFLSLANTGSERAR
jgi:EAL domain-containing protein (putative c-di-GMP-specific phosphodiesterase class I)